MENLLRGGKQSWELFAGLKRQATADRHGKS